MATKTSEKTIAKTGTKKKTEKALSELESNAHEDLDKKKSVCEGPPRFVETEKNTIVPVEKDPKKLTALYRKTTGTSDEYLAVALLTQAHLTFKIGDMAEKTNTIAAMMHGLKPRDELEGLLIAQMAGTHNLVMEFMRRAVIPKQHLEAGEDYTKRAYRLLNVFLNQMEMLLKYRGKVTQQKVTVEHVHVHEGGQAVVGNIDNKPGGGGG